MDKKQTLLCSYVDEARDIIAQAEKTIWENPELGYTEWKTHAYLKAEYEKLGYTVVEAGNIPGFYVDVDTGKPGPKVLLVGEMDALVKPDHFANVNGLAHACGHHAQCAAVLGAAYALKQPGALDGLCGSVRLMAVPAEELGGSNLEDRLQMVKDGIIQYTQGKPEFMARGYMDGVDIGMMVHTAHSENYYFRCDAGCNGVMYKHVVFTGKGKYANGTCAANLAVSGVQALLESLPDDQYIRIRSNIKLSNKARAELTFAFLSASLKTQEQISKSIDRVLVGAAIASSTQVEIFDNPGCAPMYHPAKLLQLVETVMGELVGADKVLFHDYWNRGGADMGDLSCVIPCIHPNACGASANAHSDSFYIDNLDRACVNSAKAQLLTVQRLLENDAQKAQEVIRDFAPQAVPMAEYLARKSALSGIRRTEFTGEDGEIQVALKA